MARKNSNAEPADPLVGKWFHRMEDSKRFPGRRVVTWQGEVCAKVEPGIYLVQLYEWVAGDPSNEELVSLADMAGWRFYDTSEQMNDAYVRKLKPMMDQVWEDEASGSDL